MQFGVAPYQYSHYIILCFLPVIHMMKWKYTPRNPPYKHVALHVVFAWKAANSAKLVLKTESKSQCIHCITIGGHKRLHPHYYLFVLKWTTFATFTPSIHTTPAFSSPLN